MLWVRANGGPCWRAFVRRCIGRGAEAGQQHLGGHAARHLARRWPPCRRRARECRGGTVHRDAVLVVLADVADVRRVLTSRNSGRHDVKLTYAVPPAIARMPRNGVRGRARGMTSALLAPGRRWGVRDRGRDRPRRHGCRLQGAGSADRPRHGGDQDRRPGDGQRRDRGVRGASSSGKPSRRGSSNHPTSSPSTCGQRRRPRLPRHGYLDGDNRCSASCCRPASPTSWPRSRTASLRTTPAWCRRQARQRDGARERRHQDPGFRHRAAATGARTMTGNVFGSPRYTSPGASDGPPPSTGARTSSRSARCCSRC